MANKKYDYSEDIQQSAETTTETAEASAEEVRRQRLEQRNDALANEFRKLKPAYSGRYPFTNSGDIRSVRW